MGDYVKINIKRLIVSVLIPLVLGGIVGFITSPTDAYKEMIQPNFAPPGILFPIVWSILYIIMGITSYIVLESNNYDKDDAILIYIIQLVVNLLWCFLLFTFKWYLFSFIWILFLIALVLSMIRKFYRINKVSGYLNIPYLIWLIFASVLNLSIYFLNR